MVGGTKAIADLTNPTANKVDKALTSFMVDYDDDDVCFVAIAE